MDEIQKIREDITDIDKNISILLRKRKDKAEKIGEIKKKQNLPIFDKKRELEILNSLEDEFEREIFKKILSESRKLQV